MLEAAFFPAAPAVDPLTGNRLVKAAAHVYEPTDASYRMPLEILDVFGNAIDDGVLTSNHEGAYPGFFAHTDSTHLVVKSGETTTVVSSDAARRARADLFESPGAVDERALASALPKLAIAGGVALLGASIVAQPFHAVSVAAWGAGRGARNDVFAFEGAIAQAGVLGLDVVVPRGEYVFAGTVDLSTISRPIRIVLEAGAVITQTANVPAFRAWGDLGAWTPLVAAAGAGTRTCRVASTGPFAVGDWIAIASSDVIPGSNDKIGMLRRIVSKTSTSLTVDSDFYRRFTLKNSAHVQPVKLLPRIQIVGEGRICHADPRACTSALVDFAAVRTPFVDVEIGPSGGSGFFVAWSVGPGGTGPNFHAHDLLDDPAGGHYGYGINNGGGNRGLRFQGRCERCRHGHTTGPGPDMPNSNRYGEPENIRVEIEARDCSNKALDTHRPGWNITFVPKVSGGAGGGVQLRADNCDVVGGTIDGTGTVGVAVAASVRVPGTIDGVKITDVGGSDAVGILLLGPAKVRNVSIRGFTGSGIRVSEAGCSIESPVIDGGAPGRLTGIEIDADDTVVYSGSISNVQTGIAIAAGVTGTRESSVRFGAGVGTERRAQK